MIKGSLLYLVIEPLYKHYNIEIDRKGICMTKITSGPSIRLSVSTATLPLHRRSCSPDNTMLIHEGITHYEMSHISFQFSSLKATHWLNVPRYTIRPALRHSPTRILSFNLLSSYLIFLHCVRRCFSLMIPNNSIVPIPQNRHWFPQIYRHFNKICFLPDIFFVVILMESGVIA